MTLTLRIILIIASSLSCLMCIKNIKKAKLKIDNSIVWLLGSILLIIMSIFSNLVEWISVKLGFLAPVNFVFVVIIGFLLIELYFNNIKITELNEKVKNIAHHIAIKEFEEEKKNGK